MNTKLIVGMAALLLAAPAVATHSGSYHRDAVGPTTVNVQALAELVPADVLTWDRVELATGAVEHESTPVGAEPAASGNSRSISASRVCCRLVSIA